MTAVHIQATEATIRDMENKKKDVVEDLSEVNKKLASLQELVDLRAAKQRELDGLERR
jgi:predicted  nucleic acid-binding Zn-ribbon protein